MNRNRFVQIALLLTLLIAAPIQAVQNYSCDFENKADRDRWTLNPTANQNIYNQLTNKWYVGAPGNNDKTGSHGLYISDDEGASAHYANKGCLVFAYDTVALDNLSTGEDYTLSFDYCGMGNVGSKFDGIYVFWIPMTKANGDSIKVGSIATSSGSIPDTYINYMLTLQPKAMMDYVGGTQTWKQCVVNIPNSKCDGKPHYLVFAWANGSLQTQQPGAMVDNIAILDTRPCDEPQNIDLTIQGTTSLVSWTGTAASYEVMAYSYEEDTWFGPKIVNGTSTSFNNLPIGQTDFIVRSVCAEDLFSLKTSISKLVYYPDQMCVDYLNLDNATCYTAKMPSSADTRTFNTFTKTSPVDHGPSSIASQHTIHFDKQELEPRTGFMAHTIPDGELASVRLGNWDKNNGAERIEISFDVDTINYPVLLLKYMPILEAPNHDPEDNPRFRMDILIGNQSIGQCGQADFSCDQVYDKNTKKLVPGAAEQGWHITPGAIAQANGADVVWKEWTTVGVNLKDPDYQGKKLMARLTTLDCTQSGHGGYAYFTLGCSDGKLKGMKCGQINPVFEAPDGFVYRWAYKSSEQYRDADGKIPEQYVLGHNQTFEAGLMDDSIYVVDCMFVQDSSCFFSLYASTLATNPISVMNEPKITKNCQQGKYSVSCDASPSWVQEIDHVIGDTLVSKIYHIDRYEWNVEGPKTFWSDEIAPTFDFPASGGDFTVSLRTSCGLCDSTIYYYIHLDSLGATRDTVTVALCDDTRKVGYKWSEKPDTTYFDYCLDSVVLYSQTTSCDSIIYLNLIEPVRVYVDKVVLPEDLPFLYRGRSYTETMVDTIPISASNCDTTWVLNFEVYESILANMPNSAYLLCEGDPLLTLVYDITRGRSLRYSYTFTDPAIPSITPVEEVQKKGHYEIPIAIDPDLYPNVYEGSLLLEDSLPKFNLTIPFTVTMQYASVVIAQRWNDVLAIKNADYNGGYQFDSVQWYLNGQPIEGATDFYYYAGEGQQLKMGESYQALLTRSTDGVKLFTCAFMPNFVAVDVNDMPSLVAPSSPMHLKGKGQASWYDMLGRLHHSENFDDSDIRTPGTAGYYLLVLKGEETRNIHRIMVR